MRLSPMGIKPAMGKKTGILALLVMVVMRYIVFGIFKMTGFFKKAGLLLRFELMRQKFLQKK